MHDFLREGLNALLERLEQVEEDRRAIIQQNLVRLSRLDKVRDYTYTVDHVSGDDYSVDEVVDIFNRVNSRGTPLKKADLALAHVCSLWPEARAELRGFAARMAERGFDVDLNFLVRCLAGVATGSVLLEGSFLKTQAPTFQDAWLKMQPAFEHLVGVLLGEAVSAAFLTVNFHEIDGQDICQVTVEPSDHPIYVEHQNKALFYLRVGNGTQALPVDEAIRYVDIHWKRPV